MTSPSGTALPVSFEAGDELRRVSAGRSRLVEYDQVESAESLLLLAEGFADDALDSVSCRSFATVLLRDGKAEPGEIGVIVPAEYGEPLVAAPVGLVEDAAVSGRCQEPLAFREPVRVGAIQSYTLQAFLLVVAPGSRFKADYGVRRARPLARRRFRTSRPALVAIRARKPCVRARFSLLG